MTPYTPMRKNLRFFLWLLILLCKQAFAQNQELSLKWGVEDSPLFHETKATSRQNHASVPPAGPHEKLYRYVTITPAYKKASSPIWTKHDSLWKEFVKSKPTARTPQLYMDYAKKNYPYIVASANLLAPQLHFNFMGKSNKVYILQSISVKTKAFEEYSGGGFVNEEAWYDIVLNHHHGTKEYTVNNQLRFTASGTATLRFFSDNFIQTAGMAPMGCYMLTITFNFLSDGKIISVATEPFKIDV